MYKDHKELQNKAALKTNFQVLLSLYKPNRDFLLVQLESLKQQINVDIQLIVRIDGFDSELQVWLTKYLEEIEMKFTILTGERIGACASYFELLKVIENYDFVALADQDDYWVNSKLESTIYLTLDNTPVLSIAGMISFKYDEDIPKILDLKEGPVSSIGKVTSFNNALVENVFQGARMTLNKSAIDLIKSSLPAPENTLMHDAWIYLVISSFGFINQVKEITFLYRQHENNLIGLNSGKFINRVQRNFSGTFDKRISMAKEFSKCFPNSIHAANALTFSKIYKSGRIRRLKLLWDLKIKRSKKSDLFFFYLAVFLKERK